MALETASYIANLVVTNPDGADQRSTADDHIRLIKAALRRTFPNLDSAVSLSASQFAFSNDLSASVQLQLNQLRDGSATANNAVNSRFANSASLALYANSASYAALAATANSASYAALAGQAASASFATLAATANSASYAVRASHAASASFAVLAATANSASHATIAATAVYANSASYAVSAGSAASLHGYPPDDAASLATVALRTAQGHIFCVNVNMSATAGDDTETVNQIIYNNGTDGYLRKGSLAYIGQALTTRNISGRAGVAKTLSTSTPSGGSNGDIWYRY